MNRHKYDLADAVAAWQRGDLVTTVEMGGMGPGYEQCIQILVWELCRCWKDGKVATAEAIALELNKSLHFSGAQVGVAINCARSFIRDYDAAIKGAPEERIIMAMRTFPTWEPVG